MGNKDGGLIREHIRVDEQIILNEIYKKLHFSIAGEGIAAFIYIQIVYLVTGQYLLFWGALEATALMIQGLVVLSFHFYPLRFINYKWAYCVSLSSTFVTMAMLSLFYTFDDKAVELSLGVVYVAIATGGALFHCYIKYLHIGQILSLFIPYTLMCLFFYSQSVYIGLGALIFMVVMVFASTKINNYMNEIFKLLQYKEISLDKMALYKDELAEQVQQLERENQKLLALETQRMQINDKLVSISATYSRQNALQEQVYDYAYEKIDCLVFKTDPLGKIISVNQRLIRYFKLQQEADLQHFKTRFLSHFDNAEVLRPFFPFTPFQVENQPLILRAIDGRIFACHLIHTVNHQTRRNLWILKDVTEQTQREEALFKMTYLDGHTQIYNKYHLQVHFDQFRQEADRQGCLMAFVYLDINGFKYINDSKGHAVGDQLLQDFSQRLRRLFPAGHYACRIGGDEFLCIFNQIQYKEEISPLIEQLKSSLEQDYAIDNSKYFISTSMGVSYYPCDATRLDDLMRFADLAMYQAKEEKMSPYRNYHPALLARANDLQQITAILKSAIESRSFSFMVQPIYDLITHQVAKVEILIRLTDYLNPEIFIPLAERLALIKDIGVLVIREACRMSRLLREANAASPRICINISQYQFFYDADLIKILEIIKAEGGDVSSFEFEFQEEILAHPERAQRFFNLLKEQGARVIVDDFGMGYSSLSHLRVLPIDGIKIDREFIDQVGADEKEHNIFTAMLSLAEHLDFEVTIKRIETKAELNYCLAHRCHFGQGYLFSKPLKLQELQRLMQAPLIPNPSTATDID